MGAPKIPDLLRRIHHLFGPHKTTLTIALVLVGAAISVLPHC